MELVTLLLNDNIKGASTIRIVHKAFIRQKGFRQIDQPQEAAFKQMS